MPRKATATVEADPILACIETHCVGNYEVFRRGTRLHRSQIHPYSAPYWAVDGSDDVALGAARRQLHDQGPPPPAAEPVAPRKKVRATKNLSAGITTMVGAGPRFVNAGDVLFADDPFAIKFSDAFEPIEDDGE